MRDDVGVSIRCHHSRYLGYLPDTNESSVSPAAETKEAWDGLPR